MPKARQYSDSGETLRVVTLVDHLVAGGGERLAVEITLGLDPDRHHRVMCLTRAYDPGDEGVVRTLAELRESGVEIMTLDRSSRWDLRPWLSLLRHLRARRVDVLHAHKFGSNLWGVLLGRLVGVPVVVAHDHTWSFEGQPLRRLLDRHVIARLADVLVAVSREDERKMHDVERIAPRDTTVIGNGIRVAAPTGKELRRELGIVPGAPVLVSTGMLRPQKAFHVLLRAVRTVADERPDVRLLIAGGPVGTYPSEPARLEALTAELGLRDAVHFLGRRDDVPDVLAAADVAVLSSDFEGSPLSVMEYMAAGLPVVATRVGGVPELITDGHEGRLVEPADPGGLARAILDVLRDPEASRRMGDCGRRRQREQFDLQTTVAAVQELYAALLVGRSRARG